jgi:hypothetical protein
MTEGKVSNRRLARTLNSKSPPTTRIGKWRNGTENPPGAARAYEIGRNLERVFNCPTSGLDALIVADCWADAIGCIGEWNFDYDDTFPFGENVGDEPSVLDDVYAKRLHRKAPPAPMSEAMDKAWVTWISNRDPSHFQARIHAGYILAKSNDALDQATAMQILSQWARLPESPAGFWLDRKVRRPKRRES